MLKLTQIIRQCKNPVTFSQLKVNHDFIVNRTFSDTPISVINEALKKHFYEPKVQELLKQLTRPDLNKIFRARRMEKKLKTPVYKFMTTEQLEAEIKAANERAEEQLQMPPVLPPRKEINEVLSVDPDYKYIIDSKFVFTDISFARKNRNRLIVVREPDGTLRKGTWDERHRMNEVYFSTPGRKMFTPKLFQPENLMKLCQRQEFEFILDLACLQYEPDDPEFLRITVTTYDQVDEALAFEKLRSTRHYGPLMFHIAAQRTIDNLIVENFQNNRLEDAVWAIQLYHLIHPESKSADTKYIPGEELKFIKEYIQSDSKKKGLLEMTLRKYVDVTDNVPGIQQAS